MWQYISNILQHILIPLPYLFVRWRALRYIAKAESAKSARAHQKYLLKATETLALIDRLNFDYPEITRKIELKYMVDDYRKQMAG